VINIFRHIEMIDEGEGVLIDMHYRKEDNAVLDMKVHRIVDGVVGPRLDDVPPLYISALCATMTNVLNENEG